MRLIFSAIVVAVVASAGCATTPKPTASAEADRSADDNQSPAPAPGFDIEAAVKQELPPLSKQEISAESLNFRAQTEASGPVTYEPGAEVVTLTIPLGTGQEIICEAHKERIDTASTIGQIVKNVAGAVDLRAVRPVEVVAIRGAPAQFMELDYLTSTDAGKAFGQLKLMVYTSADVSFVCNHDEPGYRESFRRILKDLTASVQVLQPTAATRRFVDLQSVKLQHLPVGYSERTVFPPEKGLDLTESLNAIVLARSATEVVASDTVIREWSDKTGTLVQMKYVKALNGELVSNLDVVREGRSYKYSGTWNGKPVEGQFESKSGVPGEMQHWKLLRERLLSGKKSELTVETYSPTVNPAAATPVVYRQTPGEEGAIAIEVAGMKANGWLDKRGILERTEVPLGEVTMTHERIFTEGQP